MTKIVYITVDEDGTICEWEKKPVYNGSIWENEYDICLTENMSTADCQEQYDFIPAAGKCYEVTIETTCTHKEIE